MPSGTQMAIKQQLVYIVMYENERPLRKKVSDVISELVRMQFGE